MSAGPVLSVCDLSYAYPGHAEPVLSGVGFEVYARERIALVGPSGCGKTTLLRLLEGSLKADATVERQGRAVLVYQDLRLVDEATALENVGMGMLGRAQGRTAWGGVSDEAKERARELLAEVGLSTEADRRVSSLSGGQRQRVAIARALAAGPDVLLADEPFANLDTFTARRIGDLLLKLQQRHGFALVCSVHDPSRVAGLFDRVLEVGSIGCCGCVIPCGLTSPKQEAKQQVGRSAAWALGIALFIVSLAMLYRDAPPVAEAIREGARFLGALVPFPLSRWADVPWGSLFSALAATLQMAFLGTVLGAMASLPLALAASLPDRPGPLSTVARGMANVVRAVPSLLWALMFVAILGIGPMSGVAALAAYSTGYLTRLFGDVLENTDRRPAMALRQLGASRLQALLRAVVRPSAPGLAGAAFFVFEYNVRAASVLGIVGAGGIGTQLSYYIEWRRFDELSAALVLIITVACLLDALSRRVRLRLAAARGM
jgi:phosphonate transport system permease protein